MMVYVWGTGQSYHSYLRLELNQGHFYKQLYQMEQIEQFPPSL